MKQEKFEVVPTRVDHKMVYSVQNASDGFIVGDYNTEEKAQSICNRMNKKYGD